MNQQTDYSIDLETLGKGTNAAVTAIGVAAFNRETGEVTGQFYAQLDLQAVIDGGGKIDASTLQWWATQNQTVFKEAIGGNRNPIVSLMHLEQFIEKHGLPNGIWGNGSIFDVRLLAELYGQYDLTPIWECPTRMPYGFAKIRDMRTIVDAARALGFNDKAIPRGGDHHNAIHDAIHQAKVISACWRTVTNQVAIQLDTDYSGGAGTASEYCADGCSGDCGDCNEKEVA